MLFDRVHAYENIWHTSTLENSFNNTLVFSFLCSSLLIRLVEMWGDLSTY